jgi:hypothetical protein
VRRIYRRVCILRVKGQPEEAAALEASELEPALSTARAVGPEECDEAAVFAAEDERMSTAVALAELLTPLLAERLRAELGAPTGPAMDSDSAPARALTNPVAPEPDRMPGSPSAAPVVTPSARPASIADFIDGMLIQQGPTTRR